MTKRAQDLLINLLAPMNWKRRASGAYWLEVGMGEKKHKITMIPSEDKEGYYTVRAALAPEYQWQTWLANAPLEWAQQHAEAKAKLLASSEKKRSLVDENHPWRALPVTHYPKQLYMLHKYAIPYDPETLTAGEASDLIQKAIDEQARQKIEKKLAKLQKSETSAKRGRKKVSA